MPNPVWSETPEAVLTHQAHILLDQINYAIWALEEEARQRQVTVYELKTAVGESSMSKLLSSKAQVLHTIALFKARNACGGRSA